MIEFCTYFDQRYLPRGLALHDSLKQHCDLFRLSALCLDDVTYETVRGLSLDTLAPVSLQHFEAENPDLALVKEGRNLLDYYMTLTPAWILHRLCGVADGDLLTYLDADLFFFDDPAVLLAEMEGQSIGLVPHHYSRGLSQAAGRFNTGFVTVRNDSRARALLEEWRRQCIEWCEYRFDFDNGRFGDQKYLDAWQRREGVHEFEHPGSHYGPWSVADMRTSSDADGNVLVQGSPMIAFHFSRLSRLNAHIYDAAFTYFGARASRETRDLIYRPYVEALAHAYRQLDRSVSEVSALIPAADPGVWGRLPSGLRLRRWARSLHHVWQGVVNRGYVWVWRGRAF